MSKKITHEQAREVMMKLESEDVYYAEYIEEHKIMATYIKQQEKQEKLLELYRKIYHISPMKNETKESYWARAEYLDNKIKELEND